MHPSGEAARHIEKQKAVDEGNDYEPDNLAIAAIFAQLAIADALAELNRTIHDTLATGFISIELQNHA